MSAAASPGMDTARRPAWLWAGVLLLALACAAVVWWGSATHGLGVAPDSVVYLEAAENLLGGQGLSYHGLPMTHFPPGYPLVLAAAARLLGAAPFDAARCVQALLVGLNVILLAWVAHQSSAGSASVLAAVTLLLAVLTQSYESHLNIVSEPLFLSLTLACMGFLAL